MSREFTLDEQLHKLGCRVTETGRVCTNSYSELQAGELGIWGDKSDKEAALLAANELRKLEKRAASALGDRRIRQNKNRDTGTDEWCILDKLLVVLRGPFATPNDAVEAAEKLAEEDEERRVGAVREIAARAIQTRIDAAGIPAEHRTLMLEDIEPRNVGQQVAARRLASIDKNYLLCGPAGTGKTAVAAAAAASFVAKQKDRPARFVTVGEILRLPLAADETLLSQLRSVDLLVIDGVQPFTGGQLEAAVSALVAKHLSDLLLSRSQSEHLHTILVSDCDVAAVRQFLGDHCFGSMFDGYRGSIIEPAAVGTAGGGSE